MVLPQSGQAGVAIRSRRGGHSAGTMEEGPRLPQADAGPEGPGLLRGVSEFGRIRRGLRARPEPMAGRSGAPVGGGTGGSRCRDGRRGRGRTARRVRCGTLPGRGAQTVRQAPLRDARHDRRVLQRRPAVERLCPAVGAGMPPVQPAAAGNPQGTPAAAAGRRRDHRQRTRGSRAAGGPAAAGVLPPAAPPRAGCRGRGPSCIASGVWAEAGHPGRSGLRQVVADPLSGPALGGHRRADGPGHAADSAGGRAGRLRPLAVRRPQGFRPLPGRSPGLARMAPRPARKAARTARAGRAAAGRAG